MRTRPTAEWNRKCRTMRVPNFRGCKMASAQLYEPTARGGHASFSVQGRVYVWGGDAQDSLGDGDSELANNIEIFDPYIEEWNQLGTAGIPPLSGSACTSFGERVYVYTGYTGRYSDANILSCLDLKTLGWSQLCSTSITEGTADGPMRKWGCDVVHFHHDNLAVIGGCGFPTGPTQPGSSFIRSKTFADGRGWSNEIHIFVISRGIWFSPIIKGTRPPPCSSFTLTSIDNHRAVLFGGYQPGRGLVNDLYLFDFDIMEITKVEPHVGEPWPVGRSGHAGCCLGYAGDHTHLLISGGTDGSNKLLKDIWLFDVSLKKWKEVSLPGGILRLSRMDHSATAITLYSGLVEVIEFGGIGVEYGMIAETTIITFSQVGSDWELVGVANNGQRGTSERIREKMLKISEKANTTIDTPVPSPQANEMALQERVEAAMREERLRVQLAELERRLQDTTERAETAEERSQDLEATLAEERGRIFGLEARLQNTTERAEAAEERSQDLEATLGEERERVRALERRLTEEIQTERQRANQRASALEQQLSASRERVRATEIRVQETQQIQQATEEQLRQAEGRVHIAERRSQELQQRAHNAEQRTIETERRAHNAEQRVHEAEQRVHIAEQHTTEVERQLHMAEQRAMEVERRERQAESVVQQNQQDSHWLVQQREIELTEEERGRGGWATVKVANFRRTRVAAKCFYQQILVSRYNRQLFNREMNMAACLRHPNLVQFIGASLEGEPIILTELMTTSLRAELEKGPIEHAHITSISLDVARALNYLHLMQPHPIIHRDISSANVLLDPLPGDQWNAKVSDYGSVNLLRELRTVGPGSPAYAAPEASIPAEQSPKMDIFSFGVLLIEMLTDEFPAEDARQRLLDSINHAGFVNLIRRCLREDKEERPSANEIITNIQDM